MDDTKYQAYLDERKQLVSANLKESELFDKAILTLAAGVFGLSLAFIKQITPEPEPSTIWLLFTSWGTFSASILSTLVSFLASQSAILKQLGILDKWYKGNIEDAKGSKNTAATLTKLLNWTSMVLFIVSVTFLIIFIASNFLP